MKCNLGRWDRILRLIFGVFLLAYALAGGPLWAYFGVYLIFTSGWGLCPIYSWLNIKTVRAEMERGTNPIEWKFRKK